MSNWVSKADNFVADQIFGRVAAKTRDWFGVDQWHLARETINGGILLTIVLLITQLLQQWSYFGGFLLLLNAYFWRVQYRTIAVYARDDLGWLRARLEEFFMRALFFGAVCSQMILPHSPKISALMGWAGTLSVVLVWCSFYFRCASVPPPPPPRTSRKEAWIKATAS